MRSSVQSRVPLLRKEESDVGRFSPFQVILTDTEQVVGNDENAVGADETTKTMVHAKQVFRLMRTAVLAVLFLTAASSLHAYDMRTRELFNFGWRFHAGDVTDGQLPQTPDSDWRTVDLPHDFQIEQPWVAPSDDERPDESDPGANIRSRLSARGFKEMGIGWYRKTFVPDETWRDRRVLLDFEGILYVGDAWLNGEFIGKTDYGYLGFEADITGLLRWEEENVLAVRADTRGVSNSRWYTGAGLYRDVHIVVTDPEVYFTRHPLRITTNGADSVFVQAEATVLERGLRELKFVTRILDRDGRCVAEQASLLPFRGNQRTREYQLATIALPAAHRWDIDDPYLYTAEVTVHHDVWQTAYVPDSEYVSWSSHPPSA